MKSGARPSGEIRGAFQATLALCIAALTGCSVNVPAPTENYAAYARDHGQNLDLNRLLQGHALYASSCGGCHSLRRPAKYSPLEWPQHVADMREKAELSADQIPPIRDYLVTASGYLRDSTAAAKKTENSQKN